MPMSIPPIKILLVGVSCVGKTTIGERLAVLLEKPFFDLDEEIEKHFNTSIERLQNRFLTSYSYRKEVSPVLERIAAKNRDCVIAMPPSGLRDAYLRVVKKLDCVVIAIEDSAENILERITFFDIDSKPIEKHLTEREKKLYSREIRKDITYYRKSYQRAHLHVNIAGLDADESALKIAIILEESLSSFTPSAT